MPAAKKRSTKQKQAPECVPDHGDPDRKRVLNVLAQRRYRQRQKERLAELEAKANGLAPSPTTSLNVPLDGMIFAPLESENWSNAISGSSSEGNATLDVEDILRSTTETVLPVMANGIDLSQDFSTQSPQNNILHTAFHPDFPTQLLPSDPSTPSSPPSAHPPPTLFAFPLTSDPTNLIVPNFSTFRAFATIGSALGVISNFHNPNYLHTLSPIPAPTLPPNLHPTSAQIKIPHHPVLDILPWPSVREKLICMLALPSGMRPEVAREDGDEGSGGQAKAVMQIVHDLDDMAGGCRIHGNLVAWGEGNELVEEAWEMGECFFNNWWWCLDGRVVEMSNLRRRQSGLEYLRIAGVGGGTGQDMN